MGQTGWQGEWPGGSHSPPGLGAGGFCGSVLGGASR